MTSDVKPPPVLWAQRSSAITKQKNFIYLTVNLPGMIHSTLKYTVTDTNISLKVSANEGDREREYAFELDFHAEVVPGALENCMTPQSITIVIFKKDINARYWPQLSKTVLSHVKTDPSRWTWEGDESNDIDTGGSTVNVTGVDLDSSSREKSDRLLELSNQCSDPSSATMPATPQVLWVQRSSPTDNMKDIVCLSLNALDIAESTLKCVVTETSISFHSYAREDYEEREYALDLDFYGDVIPEEVEKHLTEQGLAIVLVKKQTGAEHWPRLQKAEGLLHYVRADFKQNESEQSDAIVNATTDSHVLGTICGQQPMQAGQLTKHGIFFWKRFKRLGELQDIEKAIRSLEGALQLTPDGQMDKPSQLRNFGCFLFSRFEHLGEMEDIEKSISSLENAVQLTPSGHADLPACFNNLGNSYLGRFECNGNLQDIEHAIFCHQSAVDSTPSGHANLPSCFNNLGNSYLRRFEHNGNLQDIDHAISHHQSAVDSTPSGHPDLPACFNNLGSSYLGRFECTGNLQDIDYAISHHQSAVDSTPSGHASLPGRLNNLGNSYLHRFEHSGNLQDIDHAMSYHQSAVDSTPSGHPGLPRWLNNLGNSCSYCFECTGDLQYIDQAILYHQSAVDSTPSGHAILPTYFNNLGNSYLHRFEHGGNLQDIDQAISHHQSAVDSTPSGHADIPIWFNSLGTSCLCRFKQTGNLQDIDHAISYHQSAVDSTPSGHALLPTFLSNFGNSYSCRFEHNGNLQDIDHAISNHQSAVNSTPFGHADLPSRFNNLGNSCLLRFKHTGNLHDIDHAISHHQIAVDSTPSGHAGLPTYLNNIGSSYFGRFECTGNLQDIDQAISHHQSAVDSTPSGHADLPIRFNNLGNSCSRCFEHTGNLQYINRAISYHQSAVDSTPPGHADRPIYFNNLGNSYLRCFERNGDLQDIDHAISHHQSAVDSTPSGHAGLPGRLNNLGNSYLHRFEYRGDLQDIDQAISHHQSALNSTPSGHADLPSRFNNLGNSYTRRFERTGNLQYIDHAISHHQSAVDSTPSGHPGLSICFNNLGNSYLCRFEHTGNLQDIDHAISYHQSAVDSTPSGHASLPTCFNHLGNSYLRRFEHNGDLQDIDCAISYHQRTVDSTPFGHAGLSSWFNNLGTSYSCRFKLTRNLCDIDNAISHCHSAVDSTPSDHAALPNFFNNLGKMYLGRFQYTHNFSDAQKSIVAHRQAAKANGAPSIRLQSAKLAATLSSVHDQFHSLTDFSLAICLLSEVAGLEQTIHHRHTNLHGHSDLVGFAVATALHCDKADLALEWLEQGRCLVWNQLNQLRTPIDDLHLRSPALANHFIQVAGALEFHGTRLSSLISSGHTTLAEDISFHDETRNHTLLAADYKQLLNEIRALPDFHNFLQPPKATNLISSLPSEGPVIIFNFHETRCDAMALMAKIEDPLHIPLEKFGLIQAEELQKRLQSDLLRLREVEDSNRLPHRVCPNPSSIMFVLKELWDKVVQPVLKALGYLMESCPNPSDRHRIWWCPTGPLAFLPLHAAGVYGSAFQTRQCISDFVISSYTPTVSMLNEKFKASSTPSKSPSLVIISQPNTPDLPSIPYTKMETHDLIKLMDKTTIDVLLLADSEATRDRVKTEMKSHSWAHFACHGVQDISQPLNSGLCLHNGRLELLEIMKEKIPNLDLAFLSACQTSKGDLNLSEEVVHLAAGMLAAGYHGVVGTMWSISDKHGPEFATEFYQYLLRERGPEELDSTQAAHALDYATKKVQEGLGEGDAAFLTWVPYVHFGY